MRSTRLAGAERGQASQDANAGTNLMGLTPGPFCFGIKGFMKRFVLLLALGWCLAGCRSPNASDPSLSKVHDLEGRAVNPFTNSQPKATALIFIRTDCP